MCYGGRDSSVGIATCSVLECPGMESQWGLDFQHPPDRPRVPPSLLKKGYRVSFLVRKAARVWSQPSTPI